MKLFHSIATLGALCAMSEALAVAGAKANGISSRNQFTQSKIENLNKRINTLKSLNLKGMSPKKQAKMAEMMMKKSKFHPKMDGFMLAQVSGGWWWPSWIAAVVDSAVDLGREIVSDA